ncbi:MAG: hypothetical protein JXA99_07250 [Candidatus Lokiarchaeota archaeon]|nr:hypothetical protein [Candidatus Lokiarchaeota archaeon]
MLLDFYNPPPTLLVSGSKEGVDLGGSKLILSIDDSRSLFSEGSIFTEMSWAEFYQEKGLEDQIHTFTTKKYESVRENPEALTDTIKDSIKNIIKKKQLFYGIIDLEVDAFLNENTVIPGLKVDHKVINNLMEAHTQTRNKEMFPEIIRDVKKRKKIKIEFHGEKNKNLIFHGSKLEDLANQLRVVKGFATGIVCSSSDAANFYIMNDNIIFKENDTPEFYIDKKNIQTIEMGIKRELLFPISWFRIDIGIRALETLQLWDKIKEDNKLKVALAEYEHYVLNLVFKKFEKLASSEKIGVNLVDDFYQMTPQERRQALRDMAQAIRILTKYYKDED